MKAESAPLKNKNKDSVLLKGPCSVPFVTFNIASLFSGLFSHSVISSSVFPVALYLFVLIFIIGNIYSVSLGVIFSFRDCYSCVAY